MTELHKASI